MKQDSLEVLSFFMDGEPVEADVLAAALVAPGAREALVDFAGLRAGLAADDSRPSPALHLAMDRLVGDRRRGVRTPWAILRAAAAVVVLALAAVGAISLGTRFHGNPAEEPPRATRVIQFTPGVDWHEGEPR
jgi:hypothetical protein